MALPAALSGAIVVGWLGGGDAAEASSFRGACAASHSRNLIVVSARTGAVNRSFPDVDQGPVSAVTSDGHGGWFVGGGFGCVGAVSRPSLIHLRSDGRLDPSWKAPVPADRQSSTGFPSVTALARVGSTLYAGGLFGVAAFDVATGARRWVTRVDPLQPGTNSVLSVAASARIVYVAGYLGKVGSTPQRASLVALDAQSGSLLPWKAPALEKGSYVDALALAGSRLYVGGFTSTLGGSPRPGLAALSAGNGALTRWVPDGVGDVDAILVSGGYVFTAGYDGFGVSDSRTGRVPGWVKSLGLHGRHFAASGSIVYLAGDIRNTFTKVAGMPRNNLAAVNVVTHRVTSWAPKVNRYVGVVALAVSGNEVLVAGDFANKLG